MKRLIFLITGLFMTLAMTAGEEAARKRLIVTGENGNQKVYDLSRLTKLTFDSVETVTPEIESTAQKGLSVSVNVTMPEGCSFYKIAVARADKEISDWRDYVINNSVITDSVSKTVEIGGLTEKTNYRIAALAYDKYRMASGVALTEATTVEADPSELPQIGYILYADGSWSKRRQNDKTPVGIIFSTNTSDADKEAGFTHGYALALRNAGEKVKWAAVPAELQTDYYTSSVEYGFQTDKDGRTHTDVLKSKGISAFPAAEMAVNYDAPVPPSSSGWYLPSSGQWFDICVNLGGMPEQMPRLGITEGYWNDLQACNQSLQRINEYLSLSGKNNYEKITVPSGDYQWFWTSSESSEAQAYALFFDNDQLVVEIAGYFKNYDFASNRVRAVIAF
ncbi:MAG: hypothetical protein K2L89_03965 [Muribaculaceae bacterium]|nr:hypothetical protein [Muribaculaceae bacterium]